MAQARGDRDSRLKGAKIVGLNSAIKGSFPGNDLDDLVRLKIDSRSSFTLDLSKIKKGSNVDVELYQLKQPVNTVLKSIGKIDFRQLKAKDRRKNFQQLIASKKSGNKNETIATELDAGDYFVRFLKRRGSTPYLAKLSSTPIQPPNGGGGGNGNGGDNGGDGGDKDGIGNGTGSGTIPVIPFPAGGSTSGQLTSTDPEKRYAIDLSRGDHQFNLTGLSADADLQLLAADGTTVLRSSANVGTSAERFIQPLEAGKYILRVFRKAGNTTDTNFSFSNAKLVDTFGDDQAAATNLGTIGSATVPPNVEKVNYVVANGKDSPSDYLKFQLPSRGFVKVELTGRPLDDNTLFGNLDVELYADGQLLKDGFAAKSLGNASEVFGGTLDANKTYYLRIHPQDGSIDGSTYKIKISFSGRSSRPSIVRDILVGDESSGASNFTNVNGLSYFSADSTNAQGIKTVGLWLSEGTLNRTAKLYDFQQGSLLQNFTEVNGQLYFVADDKVSGAELWTSDGTVAGTKQVVDLNPGSGGSNPKELTAVGSTLYFYTEVPISGTGRDTRTLYQLQQGSTTPQALTSPALNTIDPEFDNLTEVGGTLYFTATDAVPGDPEATGDSELWRVNGTTLEQMSLSPDQEGGSSPSNLLDVGGKLFLTASVRVPGTPSSNRELVRIDTFGGSYVPGGPNNFTVFNLAGTASAGAGNLLYVDSTKTLYFTASDSDDVGLELRKLQFTANSSENGVTPTLVKDINSGTSGSSPTNFIALNNQIIFVANDGTTTELWISDGSNSNTRKLSSLSGLSSLGSLSNISQLTLVNGKLFFVAESAAAGAELRKVTFSSTNAGTLETYDLRLGTDNSAPNSLEAVGGQLFFVANNGTDGNEPWSVPA